MLNYKYNMFELNLQNVVIRILVGLVGYLGYKKYEGEHNFFAM